MSDTPEDSSPPPRIRFSRSGTTPLGKCTAVLKTHVPDKIDDEFRRRAQEVGCSPAELLRDLVCLAMRGVVYGELTAEERRVALRDSVGPERGLLSRFFWASKDQD